MRPLLLLLLAAPLFAADADRDGIDDALEQELLQRYLPSFIVSGGECDAAPAEFQSGAAEPRVTARNGTIYGQVRRYDASRLELHYYHLWSRDCGRFGHALDAEHVSALVRAAGDSGAGSKAEYWYAAAHEDTVCDSARAARAVVLQAEEHGPQVWISQGKHGSFLSEQSCASGCGGDRCQKGKPLTVAAIINLGEASMPLNGALWTASAHWPLAAKMLSDFDGPMLARLDASDGIADLRGIRMPAQHVIAGGNRTIVEVDGAKNRTGDAIGTAEGHTERALGKSTNATGKALDGAKKSVSGWLRRRL